MSLQSPISTQGMPLSTSFLLYSALITIGMGQTVVFAILPMLGRELEVDKLIIDLPSLGILFEPKEMAITALTACTSLAFFIGAPFWGRLSDRWGRKPVIIIGLLGYTLGALLFNGVSHMGLSGMLVGFTMYGLFVGLRTLTVLVMSGTVPAASAYVVDVVAPERRTACLSKLTACRGVGTIIGPALVSFVAFGFLVPLYVHAAISLIVGIAIWLWLPANGEQFEKADDDTKRNTKPSNKLSYYDSRYRHFLIVALVVFTAQGMVQMTLGFYFEDQLGFSREEAAMNLSLALVTSSLAMLTSQFFVVGRWRGAPISLVKWGLPFVFIGCTLIAGSSSVTVLLAGMALFGVGLGAAIPGLTVATTFTVTAAEQGALAGLNAALTAMGFLVGPLLGGYLYQYSPSLAFWVAALLLALLWFYALTFPISTTEIDSESKATAVAES